MPRPPRRSSDQRFRRRVESRPPLPSVVLVCDDEQNAPAYFRMFKKQVQQEVAITIRSAARSAEHAVKCAVREKKLLDEDDGSDQSRDAVWVVIDMEGDSVRRQQATKATREAIAKNIRVALSDPCFEVWTLLHLEDTGQAFNDCKAVVDHLRQAWRKHFGVIFDKKSDIDYSKLARPPYIDSAVERAKAHWNAEDPSRTSVFEIIEYIKELAK